MMTQFTSLGFGALVLALGLGITSCSAPADMSASDSAATKPTPSAGVVMSTSKPGAAISLTHNYDGKSLPGEIETVTLTLSDMYDSGQLRVEIKDAGGLDILTDIRTYAFSMASDAPHVIEVQFRVPDAGSYVLNLGAVAEPQANQTLPKSFFIPVESGAAGAEKPRPNEAVMPEGEGGVIEMDAEETITNE